MEVMEIIEYIMIAIFGILSAVFGPGFFLKARTAKKANSVKTEAEAELDLMNYLESCVESVEIAYKPLEALAVNHGVKFGAMKREQVLDKIQGYALQNKYTYDPEKWSAKLDEYVKRTKIVNGK